MLTVLITLDHQRALQLGGDLHIIIAIDTQDILYHIAGALHIYTVGRHLNGQALLVLELDFHVERTTNKLDDT